MCTRDTLSPRASVAPRTMKRMHDLVSDRLFLRRWRETDRSAFARLNTDPRVMEFYPTLLMREQSDHLIHRFETHFDEHGFGPWAVEHRASGAFIGYIGLVVPRFQAHFTPCVEIGWRLAFEYWNKGLATEGAKVVLEHAFTNLALPEVVSFTVPANIRSRRVMEKLGMAYNPADDFEHPQLPVTHPLRRHVLYRKAATSC